jgi:ribosomal protein S18 acetylase RimI-like enzyme
MGAEQLAFREATAADADCVADLIAGDPSQESIGLCGDRERARTFGIALARSSVLEGGVRTLVGELEGRAVAILQLTEGIGDVRIRPAQAMIALRVFGPLGLLRGVSRARARARVDVRPPAGALHISELHVASEMRGRGIGGATLRHAEEQAHARGCHLLSLTTTTSNPARRLYERSGFRVVATRTDPVYRRLTGIDGRHLMVKRLDLPAGGEERVP